MKIRTQFFITLILFGLVAGLIALSLAVTSGQLEQLSRQEALASQIDHDARELAYLSNDYLLYRESQQRVRWESKFAALARDLAQLTPLNPAQLALVNDLRTSQTRLSAVFASIVTALGDSGQAVDTAAKMTMIQMSWSRLEVQNQSMIFDASLLTSKLRVQADVVKRTNTLLITGLVGIFGAYFLVNYGLIVRRTLKAIAELQAGTRVIGGGQLDFAIPVRRADEIGELARAVNQMAFNLKMVTASKADLEREIAERRQMENALRHSEENYRRLIENINDLVCEIDAAGQFVFVSSQYESTLGYTPAELVGCSAHDLIHPDDVRLTTPRLTPLGDHSTARNEWRFRHRDGQWRWFECVAQTYEVAPDNVRVVIISRDITERKKAEEALHQSEAKYRNLFMNMTEEVQFWALVRDAAGHIVTWRLVDANPPTLTTWGRTLDDIRDKTADEVLGPGATEHYLPVVQKVMADGEPYSYEDYFPNLDRHFRFATVPLGDHFITTGADITTLKKALEALRDSEEKLRQAHDELELQVRDRTIDLWAANHTLRSEIEERRRAEEAVRVERQRFRDVLDVLPAYVVLLSPDYHVPFDNRFFRERFGESHGQRCFEYLFGRTAPCEVCESYTALKNNAPHRWEWLGPDGRYYDIYDFPFSDFDGSHLILEMGLDITERKQAQAELERYQLHLEELIAERTNDLQRSETLLRTILDNLPIGVWTLDTEGRIIQNNDAARHIWAITQPIDLVYLQARTAWRVNTGQRLCVDDWASTRAIRQNETTLNEEIEIQAFDGTHKIVLNSAIPLHDAQQTITGAVITNQDITDRKRIEMENRELSVRLEARAAQLEAANKELEAFSYSVSHDLRAPLRSIDGFSLALLEDCADQLDALGQDYLQRVRHAAQHMAELIDALLSLSRLTRAEIRREPVDLSALAHHIAADLQQSDPARQVDFVIAADLTAIGDRRLFQMLLTNLLGNAWKFTAKCARARIEFGALPTAADSAEPIYFVRDNGAGFDMTYAHKLFGAFQRLHGQTDYPGTGIGLATVRRIVNRHGGRVWAEGAADQGATFYFTLGRAGEML